MHHLPPRVCACRAYYASKISTWKSFKPRLGLTPGLKTMDPSQADAFINAPSYLFLTRSRNLRFLAGSFQSHHHHVLQLSASP